MESTGVQLFARRKKRQRLLNEAAAPAPAQQQLSNRNPQNLEQVKDDVAEEEEQAGPGPSSVAQQHTNDMCTFKDLGLTDWLVSVCQTLGMTRPTHVQVMHASAESSARCTARAVPPPSCRRWFMKLAIPRMLLRYSLCSLNAYGVAERLHTRDPCWPGRHWAGADGQRQNGCFCPAHPAKACQRPFWSICPGAHTYQVCAGLLHKQSLKVVAPWVALEALLRKRYPVSKGDSPCVLMFNTSAITACGKKSFKPHATRQT